MYESIESFHSERVAAIKRGETPQVLPPGPKLALFLIPEDAYREFREYDLFKYQGQAHDLLKPLFSGDRGVTRNYNFEGKLHTVSDSGKENLSYVQLYRNGCVEALGSCLLCEGTTLAPIYSIEQEIVFRTNEYLALLQEMSVEPPIVCFLDLLGVKGLEILDSSIDTHFLDIHAIEQEDLSIPKSFIEKHGIDTSQHFRLSFDRIWNSCGYPRSFGYDNKGRKSYYSFKDED